jgi:hypothetical protein
MAVTTNGEEIYYRWRQCPQDDPCLSAHLLYGQADQGQWQSHAPDNQFFPLPVVAIRRAALTGELLVTPPLQRSQQMQAAVAAASLGVTDLVFGFALLATGLPAA